MRGNGNSLAQAPLIHALRRRLKRPALGRWRSTHGRLAGAERRLAAFETWPAWLFYAPVAGYVVWSGIRHGGISLPAAVNPPTSADGVLNVSKSGLFQAMGPGRRWLPPYIVLERVPSASPASVVSDALAAMARTGLRFPLVAKPDRGGRGAGVRRVRDERELRAYVAGFPAGRQFLLQQLIPLEHEAGVMYVRHPCAAEGRVVALALKESPSVSGDGATSLRELIERHPRARHHRPYALREHRAALDRIPTSGERVELIFARNHCKGAVFRDGTDLVTPCLERRIHEIVRNIPAFHLGRLDVRFGSLAGLQRGEDLRVIEVNGAVSEPIQAWDPGNSPARAWRTYFDQIDRLYEVGAANRALGHEDPGLGVLLAGWWRQRRVTRSYRDAL